MLILRLSSKINLLNHFCTDSLVTSSNALIFFSSLSKSTMPLSSVIAVHLLLTSSLSLRSFCSNSLMSALFDVSTSSSVNPLILFSLASSRKQLIRSNSASGPLTEDCTRNLAWSTFLVMNVEHCRM